MSIYTGRTKDEAMINAMMGVCKPCCYGGGEACGCNLCNWIQSTAPATLSLTVTSPSGGFDDIIMTLDLKDATFNAGGLVGFIELGTIQRCGVWTSCRQGEPLDPTKPCAMLVYDGVIAIDWDEPVDSFWTICDISLFVGDPTKKKLYANARLINYVYPDGNDFCHSWFIAISVSYDKRTPAVFKQYFMFGRTQLLSASDPQPVNMVESCDPAFFLTASGSLNCRNVVDNGATQVLGLVGHTFEIQVTP